MVYDGVLWCLAVFLAVNRVKMTPKTAEKLLVWVVFVVMVVAQAVVPVPVVAVVVVSITAKLLPAIH